MSDTSNATAPAPAATPTVTATPTPVPAPDSSEHYVPQKDVDRIVGERLGREREKFERDYQGKIEEAKKAAVAETTKGFETKIVNASAKSLAREMGFHDPNDALSVIDPDKLPVKDGEVDEDELKKALTKLSADKPYLVKSDQPRPRAASKPKMPDGKTPDGQEPPMKAAEALRQLAARKKH